MKYVVLGGIFKDTSFMDLTEETEVYGPFDNYPDALDCWRSKMFNHKLDNCMHRLLIMEIEE